MAARKKKSSPRGAARAEKTRRPARTSGSSSADGRDKRATKPAAKKGSATRTKKTGTQTSTKASQKVSQKTSQRASQRASQKTSQKASQTTTPKSPVAENGAAPAVAGKGARETGLRSDRALAPRSHTEKSGKYVYCIIQSTKPTSFGSIGIGAEPMDVYTIGYQDIAAVVSDTPLEVYDPTRENVLAHEGVNERVMHEYTVIPMSFGTVFKTADDIVELLRSAYPAFRDVLQKMMNKLEFGLKVLWDPDAIISAVEKEDEGLRRLREEILKQRGSTYFARMQYGRMVDSLLQDRSVYYVSEIFESLRPVSVASRANKPIGERMIMNAAFLVSRDDEAEFDAAVKSIGSRHSHLTFKYTGPWPPYNFVNIRLKLERSEDAE